MSDENSTSSETPQPDLATSNPVEKGRLELSFDLARSPADGSNPYDYFKIQNGTGQLMLPHALSQTLGSGNSNVPPTMTLNVGVSTGQETLPINEQQPVQQDWGVMLDLVTQIKEYVRETQETLKKYAANQEEQMNKLQLFENMIKQMIENKSDSSAISSPPQPHNASSSNVVIPTTSESPESLPTLTHISPELVETKSNNGVNCQTDNVVVANDTANATKASIETEDVEDKTETAVDSEPRVSEETLLREDKQVPQFGEQPVQQGGSEACTQTPKVAGVSRNVKTLVPQDDEADFPQTPEPAEPIVPEGIRALQVALPSVPATENEQSFDSTVVLEKESANVQEEEQQDLNVAEQPVPQNDNTDVLSDSSVVPETKATSGQVGEPQSQAITGPIVPQEGHAHVPQSADSPDVSGTEPANVQEEEPQAPTVAEPVVPQGQGVAPIVEEPDPQRENTQKAQVRKTQATSLRSKILAAPASTTVDKVRQGKINVLIGKCETLVHHLCNHLPRWIQEGDPFDDETLGQLNRIYHYSRNKSFKTHREQNQSVQDFLGMRQKQCVRDSDGDIFYAAFLEKYEKEEINNANKVFPCFLYQKKTKVDALEEFDTKFIRQLDKFHDKFLKGRLEQYLEIQNSRLKNIPTTLKSEIPDWTQFLTPAYKSVEPTTTYKETKFFKDQVKFWSANAYYCKSSCKNHLYFECLRNYGGHEILDRDFAYFGENPKKWIWLENTYLTHLFNPSRSCSLGL